MKDLNKHLSSSTQGHKCEVFSKDQNYHNIYIYIYSNCKVTHNFRILVIYFLTIILTEISQGSEIFYCRELLFNPLLFMNEVLTTSNR